MCIIIACDAGRRIDETTLKTCWAHNPDGGGVMWSDGKRVNISKGYLDYSDFAREVMAVPRDVPMVMHMRIGTSGGLGADVTHPFPVCQDLDTLHALDVTCTYGIAHNGVLPYPTDDSKHISDTIAYIQQIVYPLACTKDVLKSGGLCKSASARRVLKDTSAGSRLAILDYRGAIRMVGAGWQTVCRGVHASNGSWRAYEDYISLADSYDYQDDCVLQGVADAEEWCECETCENYGTCRTYGHLCFDDDCVRLDCRYSA